ncbi:hypothetical protein Cni_G05707 [Canna indica]|uniref:Protein EARLY HEADING DATE 2 n=1 Tax=Canna indica TaxID=4628 RepID=A0AAQ3Q5S5_9LILI|nr:hypothetical protein Cni_G05707 [Canna indica]
MYIKGHIIQQHQQVEENMSNLTSPSGEAASVSSNLPLSMASPNQLVPAKKKRNHPGNPDPDAEVIALSPKTLMATNRFVCEICNKGFQRDQNLQLHRRGHNLPWKLKQRDKEVRKKVYICPEVTCVHHHPSRALGDLTGVKKHFSRKHGEKKWKCEKCSKKYAVQCDWKAHSKICGTREYRCDCGTLFSRRDSFITHRAFCDALAEENSRAITGNPIPHHLQISHPATSLHQNFHLHHQSILQTHLEQELSMKREEQQQQQQQQFSTKAADHALLPWLNQLDFPSPSMYSSESDVLNIPPHPLPPTYQASASSSSHPHMSATALLQKAAQMGATLSRPSGTAHMATHITSNASPLLQEMMMNPFSNSSSTTTTPALGGYTFGEMEGALRSQRRTEEGGGGNDGMTRDFLGLRAFLSQGYPNN